MALWDAVKRMLGKSEPAKADSRPAQEEQRADEVRVVEVTSTELLRELQEGDGKGPLLLDCREQFERAQTLIPNSLHIPMNSIPYRLAELDPAQEIVVYCAHGNRSYGVAGWLTQQGYRARSLKGGIVDWQHKHGPVESGQRPQS